MPELPEVETVARDLRRLVVGSRISGVRCSWVRTLRSQDPVAFQRAVVGRTIVGTSRRAKLVVLDLDDGAAITIHLKMTGQLFVVPAGLPDDPYVRLVVAFDDGRELRFRDIRKFGRVGLARRDGGVGGRLGELRGELRGELGGGKAFRGFGPEPLDPSFSARAFAKRLRARRGRLKPLLMDQSFLAGVGNIYADEVLWAARLHPLRTVATLRPAHATRLFRHLRAILAEAVERRGSSVDDYTAPEGDGSMQERLLVYQRVGEPCARCGRPIRRIVVGGRSTHLCTWCQRLPAADRPGAAAILRGLEPRPGRGLEPAGRDSARRAAAERRAAARASAEPPAASGGPPAASGGPPAASGGPPAASGGPPAAGAA
jgi:formamidopyrimidine-DNA glycosylase